MTDRDKANALDWLNEIITNPEGWRMFYSDSETKSCAEAADELLKEQETVKPFLIREGRNKYYNNYVCQGCDNELVYGQNYCSECGRAVNWDED